MGETQVKLIVIDRYTGKRPALELFVDLTVQSLQNQRRFDWTRTQCGAILKAPTVKSNSVPSVTGGTHDAPI